MIANVLIEREYYTVRTTLGKLYINGEFFCYTLEDTLRPEGIKVPAETGIPQGSYKCNITYSGRFKREMAMIYTEPNGYELKNKGISFKGIRIHGGNTHSNTEGCILVAYNKVNDHTIQGTAEYDITKKLKEFSAINIEIVNKI